MGRQPNESHTPGTRLDPVPRGEGDRIRRVPQRTRRMADRRGGRGEVHEAHTKATEVQHPRNIHVDIRHPSITQSNPRPPVGGAGVISNTPTAARRSTRPHDACDAQGHSSQPAPAAADNDARGESDAKSERHGRTRAAEGCARYYANYVQKSP